MTEKDYISATNLAKLRAARSILRDVLPLDEAEKLLLRDAVRLLDRLQSQVHRKVRVTADDNEGLPAR